MEVVIKDLFLDLLSTSRDQRKFGYIGLGVCMYVRFLAGDNGQTQTRKDDLGQRNRMDSTCLFFL